MIVVRSFNIGAPPRGAQMCSYKDAAGYQPVIGFQDAVRLIPGLKCLSLTSWEVSTTLDGYKQCQRPRV